jgi:N-acyl amino acid synthase FeeM
VNTSTLPEQYALPLEIAHTSQWVHSLLQSSHFRRSIQPDQHPELSRLATAPPLRPNEGLRTLVAVLPEQFRAADDLVRKRYAWRGYHVSSTQDSGTAGPVVERQPVTLLAEDCGRLLGTLTVRPDSPDGLLAEQSYGAEIERLRREGRRVGELVKLAVEEGVDWKAALDALVQSAYLVTRVVHLLTDILIEVNPRHVRFYQRVFGFVVAAGERICARAGAPSVLMRLDIAQFAQRLELSAA